MFDSIFPRKKAEKTAFSEFIRNAKSSEKKKVYGRVLDRATKQQQAILKTASS